MNTKNMPTGGIHSITRDTDSLLAVSSHSSHQNVTVIKRNKVATQFDQTKIYTTLHRLTEQLQPTASIDLLAQEACKNLYDGIATLDIERAILLAALSFLESDPVYDIVAMRTLLQTCYKEVFGTSTDTTSFDAHYRTAFITSITQGIHDGVLHDELATFDLTLLAQALDLSRDHYFTYLGLQTLYERYFLKINKKKIEAPQIFWMRIAMGIALQEPDKNNKALEFYEILSNLLYVPSTPTLFHAGYTQAQLSSCFLTTINDDLEHIFKCMGDNAQLAKWAGGIGNDWTNIRGTGSMIKSIHAPSQGVVPFLKIANDVIVGITRGGIRRGGTCAYLETWHLDIEDFLDLRKNTGDERRRTHDMNTANWIPDLFMKRVIADQEWTLFSPHTTPDLHDLYGKAFELRYEFYEQQARDGNIEQYRTVSAQKLWRKMLTRLFETGHPWITFKDPCNIRSPQDHVGVIHSSNLCTEITLNTSSDETAVCNLGSINLGRHIVDGTLDNNLLEKTVTTAVRMLDNVIDLNFYPTQEAYNSNMRHRPIGLGTMGVQDALFKCTINFEDNEAIAFADNAAEHILYYAIRASSNLAQERGTYSSYKGSKWDRGIFPLDTLDFLEEERGYPVNISRTFTLDWDSLKAYVNIHGMRNSNLIAIAPTATIANIAGCYPCTEPMYKNIYVKANIAGEFTITNTYLVHDLKQLGLWNQTSIDQLKYYDGSIQNIAAIPDVLKHKYKTAFEIDPIHLLRITAARGKWIDQSQSHNVFMQGVSGQKLHEIYVTAWHLGLKTTYYLRTLGATQVEKSTLNAKQYGYTQTRTYISMKQNELADTAMDHNDLANITDANACTITDATCESCQ